MIIEHQPGRWARLGARPGLLVPVSLLVVTIVAFGLFTRGLGFYWDDWGLAWVMRSDTYPMSEYFASDRPLQGLLYQVAHSVLPTTPLPWHLLLLTTCWLCSVAVWWVLCSIWPRQRRTAFMVACLFLLYPGFTHQPIALIYSLSHYLPFLGFLVSLACSLEAVRRPDRRTVLLVVGLAGFALSVTTEYFLALEVLRAFLLSLVIGRDVVDRSVRRRRTLQAWAPYLLLTVLYGLWRFVIFRPTRSSFGLVALSNLRNDPAHEVLTMPRRVGSDVIETGVLSWARPFNASILDYGAGNVVFVALGLGLVVAAVAVGTAWVIQRPGHGDGGTGSGTEDREITRGLLVGGLVGLVAGGIPAWFTARQVVLGTISDRFTLPAILGASLFAVGVLRALRLSARSTLSVFAVLVAFATSFHVQNHRAYATAWTDEREVLWQLEWYAPSLADGTTVVLEADELLEPRDYALSAALADLNGARLGADGSVPFWVFPASDLAPTVAGEGDERAAPADETSSGPLDRDFRGLRHRGRADAVLVAVVPERGCLRVLDRGRPELATGSDAARSAARHNSPADVVVGAAGSVPPGVARPEPPHGWCHSFQRLTAALAADDLDAARAAVDAIDAGGLRTSVGEEWIPVAETYLRTGAPDRGLQALDAAAQDPTAVDSICTFIDRIATEDPGAASRLGAVRAARCGPVP